MSSPALQAYDGRHLPYFCKKKWWGPSNPDVNANHLAASEPIGRHFWYLWQARRLKDIVDELGLSHDPAGFLERLQRDPQLAHTVVTALWPVDCHDWHYTADDLAVLEGRLTKWLENKRTSVQWRKWQESLDKHRDKPLVYPDPADLDQLTAPVVSERKQAPWPSPKTSYHTYSEKDSAQKETSQAHREKEPARAETGSGIEAETGLEIEAEAGLGIEAEPFARIEAEAVLEKLVTDKCNAIMAALDQHRRNHDKLANDLTSERREQHKFNKRAVQENEERRRSISNLEQSQKQTLAHIGNLDNECASFRASSRDQETLISSVNQRMHKLQLEVDEQQAEYRQNLEQKIQLNSLEIGGQQKRTPPSPFPSSVSYMAHQRPVSEKGRITSPSPEIKRTTSPSGINNTPETPAPSRSSKHSRGRSSATDWNSKHARETVRKMLGRTK